jgi:hemerythrin-like domain-containing protein
MSSRRRFFASLGGAGAAVAGFGLGTLVKPRPARPAQPPAPDVFIEGEATPLEDLMQEHAVLERVLLVYEEASRRLVAGRELAPELLARAGGIIRRYIEDHHERDEEQHVFPRLERVGVAVELIHTLRAQHDAGRRLTSEVIGRSTAAGLRDAGERAKLVAAMQRFLRMYRPHAARENTVLFPAFRKAVSRPEYERLRDTLERSERAAFGGNPFETFLAEVGTLERALGIDELAAFTPTE